MCLILFLFCKIKFKQIIATTKMGKWFTQKETKIKEAFRFFRKAFVR